MLKFWVGPKLTFTAVIILVLKLHRDPCRLHSLRNKPFYSAVPSTSLRVQTASPALTCLFKLFRTLLGYGSEVPGVWVWRVYLWQVWFPVRGNEAFNCCNQVAGSPGYCYKELVQFWWNSESFLEERTEDKPSPSSVSCVTLWSPPPRFILPWCSTGEFLSRGQTLSSIMRFIIIMKNELAYMGEKYLGACVFSF